MLKQKLAKIKILAIAFRIGEQFFVITNGKRTVFSFGPVSTDRNWRQDVAVQVQNEDGRKAWGYFSGELMTLWGWRPKEGMDINVMNGYVGGLGNYLQNELRKWTDFEHPILWFVNKQDEAIQKAAEQTAHLPQPMQPLMALAEIAPFANAIYDAWAKAANMSFWDMLKDEEITPFDCGTVLGQAFNSIPLGLGLRDNPLNEIERIHTFGGGGDVNLLAERVRSESGLRHIKIKANQDSPNERAGCIIDVWTALSKIVDPSQLKFYVDFNEEGSEQDGLQTHSLLEKASDAERLLASLVLFEQPISRDTKDSPDLLKVLNNRVTTLADEVLTDSKSLVRTLSHGYGALAHKLCRPLHLTAAHSAVAVQHGRDRYWMDLTHGGAAFPQHLNAASRFQLSADALECNGTPQFIANKDDGLNNDGQFNGIFEPGSATFDLTCLGERNAPGLGIPEALCHTTW